MSTYTGKRWKRARKAAMSRDSGRCQACGTSEDLHAHHIKPVREFDNPEDAHYLENLVILCKHCHRRWEGRRERPKLAEAAKGITINEVAHQFAADTVSRCAISAALPEIFAFWVKYNPGVCSTCIRVSEYKGRYPDFKKLHQIIKFVAEGRDPPLSTEPIKFQFKERTCGRCSSPDNSHTKRNRDARSFAKVLNRCGLDLEVEKLKDIHIYDYYVPDGQEYPYPLFHSTTRAFDGIYLDGLLLSDEHYEQNLEISQDGSANSKSREQEYREWYESETDFEV